MSCCSAAVRGVSGGRGGGHDKDIGCLFLMCDMGVEEAVARVELFSEAR
jgi:hypothetical protein